MAPETFEAVELGEAEALIEIMIGDAEEDISKMDPKMAPYVEFECPSGTPSLKCT